MEAIWARIDSWLRQHAPDELENVRPPASNRGINRLEDTTGLRLPTEMEQAYKLHDGYWVEIFWFENVYGGVLSSLTGHRKRLVPMQRCISRVRLRQYGD